MLMELAGWRYRRTSSREALMPKLTTMKIRVIEVFDNGEERCEVRWPAGAKEVDSPLDDWRQVRNVDLNIDPMTGEAVFSFTRKKPGWRVRRSA
jgi:hypothetical protein